MRQADMNKENSNAAKVEEPTARITRARLKALGNQGGVFPTSKPSFKQDQKRVLRSKAKRAAADENKAALAAISGLQCKRRAVLKDVSNISNENLKANCSNAADFRTNEQDVNSSRKNVEVADTPMETTQIEEDPKTKLAEELSKIRVVENHEMASPEKIEGEKQTIYDDIREDPAAEDPMLASVEQAEFRGLQKKEEHKKCGKSDASSNMSVVDIDSNLEDSHVCSLYAPDIFENIRVTELDQRPSTNYMERLQQDITSSMRGILIDWLVEVSEEYKLVPDTLHLTVNLIDRFLSHNHIEKQRLQLLGVTCMLIASKYEEICAPRVEEFCFITDNTYTRGEVLKMESQVLNFLYFRLTVPTTKTFLRRFIQAAQASYKVPCVELEFLANYLAELTLLEYNFLKFLPSIIAASAVFLARWTLNQSDHPWNPTLEHYTRYKVSELETTVIALEELQLNSSGCPLNATREKYRQQKFKCVANLTSQRRVLTLFER